MSKVVDKPIINHHFEGPTQHYVFSRDEPPKLVEGWYGGTIILHNCINRLIINYLHKNIYYVIL
jgi:hypothetical protein